VYKRQAPESITFGDELHTSIKESVHGWPAREVVAGKELEDAFKASALQSKVLSNLKPQKVMLTPENIPLVRKMMDDMVGLEPSLLKDKQWVSTHRDLERIADLGQHGEIFGKGIDNLNLLDSTITGIGQKADLTAMALHTVPAFDIELVAARAGDQLRRSGVSQRVLGALQDVVKQTARESSEEKVKALLRFRNITREFGVTDFDTVTSILDPLLTDVSVFEAKAADRISLYIKGTDDLLAAQQSFEASFKTAFDSRVIDSATSLDSLRVGEMADASGNMKSAAIGLEEAGLIDMDQLRLLLQGAEGLEDVVISAHPGMKAAVAMNLSLIHI